MNNINSDIDFFDVLPELRPEFIEKVRRERAKSAENMQNVSPNKNSK